VAGVSTARDAIAVLTIAGKEGVSRAARAFTGQQNVRVLDSSTSNINGLPAATILFQAQAGQAVLGGYAAFIELDGTTYRILTYTAQERVRSYNQVFRETIGSFRRLTDPERLTVRPQRVRLVQLTSRMTLSEFNERYPSVIPIEQLATINGADSASASLAAGTLVKRVVAE